MSSKPTAVTYTPWTRCKRIVFAGGASIDHIETMQPVKLPPAVGVFVEDGKAAHGMENGGRYLIRADVVRMLKSQGVEVEG